MLFDNLLAKYINIINSYIINFSIAIQSVCIFLLDCINFEIDNKLNCMKKFAKISFLIFVCLFAVALVFVGGIFVYINTAKSNVTFDKAKLVAQNTSIDIFDTGNNKINKDTGKKAVINIEELPDYVPKAFICIEDKDFYKHHGLNYKRIAKAFVNNIKSKSLKEGASTISQQLIKNTHLTSEKTITRKLNEMALAKELEKTFSKNEILEMYLNTIYFGSGAYGLENASKLYFDKPASKLSIQEASLLAGIIKSPRTYSPLFNNNKALERRNLVLLQMKNCGVITNQQYTELIQTPIKIKQNISRETSKNFYEQGALEEAESILNLSENQIALAGYKIFTYQVPTDQNALKQSILNKDYYDTNSFGNTPDGAGIVIDNSTGGITAFDGKSVYDIVNMKRSPGSSIKPILVYAPALQNGKISPSTMILDQKQSFGEYSPKNVGDVYYGWIDATKSVEKSLNIPAIKIMEICGINNCKKFAERAGIKFDATDQSYAIALGGLTHGTTIKQLVNTYVPFANNGKFLEAKFIKKICDSHGKVIYQNAQTASQIMSPETAYLMTTMLVSGVKKGTSCRLRTLPFEVAGKTGTVGISGTNFNSDVWSIGYTPQKTVGVWLGNSTGEKEFRLEGRNNGGTFCTSIVKQTLENIDIDKSKTFARPNGIIECTLDNNVLEKQHTLALANPETPQRYTKTALFNKNFAPTIVADKFTTETLCIIFGEIKNSKPQINFEAIKEAKYKLYRIEEDEKHCVATFENKSGLVTFADDNVLPDTTYTYYIEVAIDDQKLIKSNSITLTIPQTEFKRILSNW